VKLREIRDPDDPALDDYRDVRDPAWLRERRIFLAEGRAVVRTLLGRSRFRARSVLVTPAAFAALRDALEPLDENVPVLLVSNEALRRVSGVRFHQGCVAVAGRSELAESDLLARLASAPRVLVLEGLSDPDNVGASFRSALALGVGGVLLSPGCASPLYRKAVRTSLGATLRLPFSTAEGWPETLDRLRGSGFSTLALAPDGDVDLSEYGRARAAPERLALVVGSEGSGLSSSARARCDAAVRIPMSAGVDSLNAAAATALALWHLRP
jgi:tRNA G18 (ribose-2'-O)-methylase SpoU